MAELLALKKQRSVNKGKVTLILNSAKKSSDMSIEECKARLHRVEKLMDEFTVIENNIFSLDPTQDPDMEYEENYYKAITELNKMIRKISFDAGNTSFDNQLNTTQSGADVRLPKLNIPAFSGDYTEWQSFYDLYVSSIHDSTSLSPVQKFQYLKGLLRGEAASLLRHFSITEANYIEALQKLRQRYDRKRYTMNAFIRTFIEQPSINTANNSNIKRLLDTSDEVLRGLKAMGPHGEDRDPWLLYILVNKLDDESKSLWAQETTTNDFPAIKDLFEFLLRRCDALESVRCSNKRSVNSTNKPQPIKAHIATQDVKCPICKSDGHFIYHCPEFNGMNVQKRRELIQSTKRCFNCLSDKHANFKCLSRRRCPICKGKHHTLLHLPEEEAALSESKEGLVNSTSNSSLTHHCRLNTIQSILPTALVQVICSTGQTMPCRALLDSGSQTSFMTESCLQRLGIPRKNGRITIKGLGQVEAGVTKGAATIQVETRSGSVLTINVLILKSITKLPQMSISASNFKNWETLPLADPDFYKANEIDVLIGIDHFFNVLIEGQIKSDENEPVLQNTVFGWIVAGAHVQQNPNKYESIFGFTTNIDENNIDFTLKRFWELESIPNDVSLLSPDEELCEASFTENLQRTSGGRFQVRSPFKKSTSELGKSLTMAIQRLKGMERRFLRDDEFYDLYKEFMNEYLALGHMQEIPQLSVQEASFFLPHHGVTKKDPQALKYEWCLTGLQRRPLAFHLMIV